MHCGDRLYARNNLDVNLDTRHLFGKSSLLRGWLRRPPIKNYPHQEVADLILSTI